MAHGEHLEPPNTHIRSIPGDKALQKGTKKKAPKKGTALCLSCEKAPF
jgi:hypothetical protein